MVRGLLAKISSFFRDNNIKLKELERLRSEAYKKNSMAGKRGHNPEKVERYVSAVIKYQLKGVDVGDHFTSAKNFDVYEIIFARETERKLKKERLDIR